MKLDADVVMSRPLGNRPIYQVDANRGRIEWDSKQTAKWVAYEDYWAKKTYQPIPASLFTQHPKIWLEIGAGSGWFFSDLAKLHPEAFLIAIERSRMRGRRLVDKADKLALPNFTAFRGNAIPSLLGGIPDASVERLYFLYPCPWPKTSQRKNRWYLHPVMPHLLRVLKKDGLIIWTSDQKFYIDEAQFVCESKYHLKTLAHGELTPNPYNDLEHFPLGRSKFEQMFRQLGHPSYEVVVQKTR